MAFSRNARRAAGATVDLRIDNDIAGELSLSEPKLKTLGYLADRGGEVDGWTRGGIKQATSDMIDELTAAGLVREREYVGSGGVVLRSTLWLTDKGRNVIELHRKRKIVVGEANPITVEVPS